MSIPVTRYKNDPYRQNAKQKTDASPEDEQWHVKASEERDILEPHKKASIKKIVYNASDKRFPNQVTEYHVQVEVERPGNKSTNYEHIPGIKKCITLSEDELKFALRHLLSFEDLRNFAKHYCK